MIGIIQNLHPPKLPEIIIFCVSDCYKSSMMRMLFKEKNYFRCIFILKLFMYKCGYFEKKNNYSSFCIKIIFKKLDKKSKFKKKRNVNRFFYKIK